MMQAERYLYSLQKRFYHAVLLDFPRFSESGVYSFKVATKEELYEKRY